MSKAKKRREAVVTDTVIQFRITLLDIEPPIWRRIQVDDCTLNKFHEHIQTAFGWSNSHLHLFEIAGEQYGDSYLLCEEGESADFEDSHLVDLGELLDGRRKGFSLRYVYNFGDNWEHEIVLEDRPVRYPKTLYPVCLEGQRARPPEDCGGAWSYQHLLEVLADPKHEEYEDLREWAAERDPEKFSATETTQFMHEGPPDWQ